MEVLSLTSREMPCAQRDELQQLTVLARDAAEILFEMAAMQDKSPEAHDMLGKSQQIEVGSLQGLQLEHSAYQSCCFALLLLQQREHSTCRYLSSLLGWQITTGTLPKLHQANCMGLLMIYIGESLTDAMLQAQLRGMIGDFKGGDEMLLSQALQAFDTLTNTTTEYRAALEGKEAAKPVAGMSESSKLQPPGSNPFQVSACIFHTWQDHCFHCAAHALGLSGSICIYTRPIPHAHST